MLRGPLASLLLLLFVGSGCAALIYEIVWFQLLELVIGSTAVSLAVLLGTFMGGMCLGSLALPRLVSPRRHPLRVCALLELAIGAMGAAVLIGMPHVVRLFAGSGHGPSEIFARGAICGLCLLPPTVLMGATLPAISRWLETTPRGISWLGFFYGGNTAGAVFGCLLAGFYLLRVHDMATATRTAAVINLSAALLGFGLAARFPQCAAAREEREELPEPGAGAVYFAIAFSGMSALGAEVVWTRLISLMLGPTVYTFSIILAVFLLGLAIGGSGGGLLARLFARPRVLFAGCQALLALAIAWTARTAIRTLPYWPVHDSFAANPWLRFRLDSVRCLWAILPAAILWGASFPLALAAAARPGRDPGRLVGGIYSANTVGAILGAIAFSLLIVPWAGTQGSERVLIALAAAGALLLLAPARGAGLRGWARAAWVGGVALGAACLTATVPRTPGELVAYGHTMVRDAGSSRILYMGEGMNASVAVSEMTDGVRQFHVSGKVEASTTPQDMRLQRMLAHLPAMLHPKPRSVLIVGCGAGVTAGGFVVQPGIGRIVICEIEPLVPRVVARYFASQNHGVVSDPRVEIVFDDARHYILTTKEKFDIITSDPIHPWVKGSASLYTQEYFEMCKERLNPGGMVTQWVPLYESDEATVMSEFATFFRVFPEGTIWANDDDGSGYDVVLLGQSGPARVDMDALQERWSSPAYKDAAASLAEVGFSTPADLLSTYAGRAAELAPWLADAQINRDSNLRLQYLAGLGLNFSLEASIYSHMLEHLRYPENLFFGSEESRTEMARALADKKNPVN
ncbi:MAG: fused MFS/spermidine synthase [Opitutaceae bacterium]|jgi:spermidine synthase